MLFSQQIINRLYRIFIGNAPCLDVYKRQVYYHIKEKLNETKASRDKYIAAFIAPVQKKLEEAGLKFQDVYKRQELEGLASAIRIMKESHAGFQPVERILEYICGVGSLSLIHIFSPKTCVSFSS